MLFSVSLIHVINESKQIIIKTLELPITNYKVTHKISQSNSTNQQLNYLIAMPKQ